MKHIPLNDIATRLPNGWLAKAEAAFKEVSSAGIDVRASKVNEYREIWSDLRQVLSDLSHRACWYCETRQDRSDKAVDHFRPKNHVAEAPEHPGYWWLAFEWQNYRYSCTFCNSRRKSVDRLTTGGKHDHFPLADEAARVYAPPGFGHEEPLLLDPTCVADTVLLYFKDDGTVSSRYTPEQNAHHHLRADLSIRLYHLNHEDTVEARRELARYIRQLVDVGVPSFVEVTPGSHALRHSRDHVVSQLRELMSPTSEFSRAAGDIIKGLTDNSNPWLAGV